MCGIAGEINFRGVADATAVRRMLPPLARRGPDDEGLHAEGPVALGHRRLAIIDLSPAGHQPMRDAVRGLALVFNGTIYNYTELREELRALGYAFASGGDTEVILRAWAEWGPDCVERFLGMFAFALWDAREQALHLVRDRLGIKPLYYTANGARARFASSTQALLAAGGVDTGLDPWGLQFCFHLHAVVPAPRTVLAGVRKLPPAHRLRMTADGRQSLHRYWTLEARRPEAVRSDGEWLERVHAALGTAVRRRMLASDVPVGVLLSGGLDSSLIVALLAEQGQRDIRTFSIGFEDQPEEKGSEFEYSDPVAARYGTAHERILIPNSQVLARLPEAVAQMSEPMFAQDAVAFYLLAGQVSRHVKVVQSGQGADEVFAGYFWYPRMHEAGGGPLARFAPHYLDREFTEYQELMGARWQVEDAVRPWLEESLQAPSAGEYIDQVLRLDVTTLIVDDPVRRVDSMTMAFGLEARTPFLDHELVELVAAMPPHLKLSSGGKHALKLIARGLLPDAVIDRPKGYFPMPALKYVRGPFLEFMRSLLDSRACRERGLFQREAVERLLAAPDAPQHFTPILGSKLWQLAAFELWMQRVVDAAPSAAQP
jgi:asparagine synthase (glutamine-hydrolysing)